MLRCSSTLHQLPFSLSLLASFVVLQTFLTYNQHNLLFVESATWILGSECDDISISGEPNKFCHRGSGSSPSPAVDANGNTEYVGSYNWNIILYDSAGGGTTESECQSCGAPSKNVIVGIDTENEEYTSCTISVDAVECSSCSICESNKVSADCTNIPEGLNVPCQSMSEYHPSYGDVSPLLPFTWQPLPKDFETCTYPETDQCFPSYSSEENPECFSSEVTLFAKGKGKVKITEIEVGDQVLGGEGDFGTVYSIDHTHASKIAPFLQFFCSHDEEPLELTGQHMLFLKGSLEPIPANRVKVGDKLQTLQGSCFVNDISDIAREGVFNVLTSSGTIIANGIVSSTYSSTFLSNDGWIEMIGYKVITQQQLFQMLLKPYRQICTGISSTFCKNTSEDERVAIGQFAMQILKHWSAQTEVQQIVSLCFIIGIACLLNILFNSWVLIPTVTFFLLLLHWKKVNNGNNAKEKINSK